MSDSWWPHELWPARLLCPWRSPGKNTGVGCHFIDLLKSALSAKETQMYRTALWTLWERARVGWFGRMALKHVYYYMWNESPVQVQCMIQGAQGWCTGMTQRDGVPRQCIKKQSHHFADKGSYSQSYVFSSILPQIIVFSIYLPKEDSNCFLPLQETLYDQPVSLTQAFCKLLFLH